GLEAELDRRAFDTRTASLADHDRERSADLLRLRACCFDVPHGGIAVDPHPVQVAHGEGREREERVAVALLVACVLDDAGQPFERLLEDVVQVHSATSVVATTRRSRRRRRGGVTKNANPAPTSAIAALIANAIST